MSRSLSGQKRGRKVTRAEVLGTLVGRVFADKTGLERFRAAAGLSAAAVLEAFAVRENRRQVEFDMKQAGLELEQIESESWADIEAAVF